MENGMDNWDLDGYVRIKVSFAALLGNEGMDIAVLLT